MHRIRRYARAAALLTAAFVFVIVLSSCGLTDGSTSIGSTGDTAADAAAAQRFVPTNLPGYIATDARSLTDSLASLGVSASLISGNPLTAGLVAQIDGMITCYANVGAVAARVYVQANVGVLLAGDIPSAGALAVVNQDRVVNNFLPCALGQGAQALSAQGAGVQPCSGSGQFVVEGETLLYLYAATDPGLCQTFQSLMPTT